MNLNSLKYFTFLLLIIFSLSEKHLFSQEYIPNTNNHFSFNQLSDSYLRTHSESYSFILLNNPIGPQLRLNKNKYENHILKSKGFADEIIFSLKLGFQFKNNETELYGLPEGILLNGSIESIINGSVFIGAGFDLWQGAIDKFKISEYNTISRDYSYSEFILYIKNRFKFKYFNLVLGMGIGSHNSVVTSIFGKEKFHTFTIAPSLGLEYYFSKYIGISIESNLKFLNSSNNTKTIFSFRTGPIISLN